MSQQLPNLTPIPFLGPGANPKLYAEGSVSNNFNWPLAPMPRAVSDFIVLLDSLFATVQAYMGIFTAPTSANAGQVLTATGPNSAAWEPVSELQGVVISAVAPTTGQVLTAESSTTANWQTPSGGGATIQTFRFGPIASLTGSTQGPYTVNFPTPYADGNYTAEVLPMGAEALGTLGATTVITAYAHPQATPGNGLLVYVTNNDSITHSITFNVFVRHD